MCVYYLTSCVSIGTGDAMAMFMFIHGGSYLWLLAPRTMSLTVIHDVLTVTAQCSHQVTGGMYSLPHTCKMILQLFSYVLQYIGSLEVGRPGSRMEIVAAMRRIRVRHSNP